MNGAELRAWRERLGKDEAWIEGVLDNVKVGMWPVGYGAEVANGSLRRRICEGAELFPYSRDDVAAYRTAYRAALEAEEARQAAERGPVEPVCPEGVTVSPQDNGCVIRITGRAASSLFVGPVGTVSTLFSGVEAPPALLEYAAALSRYRAAQHAASDRQRKLDAVRAAEEAVGEAHKAREAAYASYRETEALVGRAVGILNAARREAGL